MEQVKYKKLRLFAVIVIALLLIPSFLFTATPVDAADIQSFFPITPVEVSPGTTGSWVDVDCSSYIAAGATGVILRVVNNSGSSYYDWGVRNNGSTDARYGRLLYNSQCSAMIGVDGSRIFEAYVGSTSYIDIYLVGYTMSGVTFFTNAYDKSLSSTSTWTDIDCSTEASGAIGLIFEVHPTYYATADWGLRSNGSSDNRTAQTSVKSVFSGIIGCDGSQVCEGYIGSTYLDFYLVGYITEGATFYTNATDYSMSTIGNYQDLAALPNGGVMGFFEVTSSAVLSFDLRANGSSQTLYYDAFRHPVVIIDADSDGVIEGKIENVAVDFYLVGYATAVTTPDITTVAASNIATTTARLNSTVVDDGGEACQVRWGWGESSESAIEDYDHYTSYAGSYTTGNNPYYDIDSLDPSTTYYFRAEIYNSADTELGGELYFDTEVSVSDPTDLRGVPSDTSISLTWTKGAGGTNSIVMYRTDTYPATYTDGTEAYDGTSASYNLTGLTAGTTYYFAVWCYSGETYSSGSSETMVTTLAGEADAEGGAIGDSETPDRWSSNPDSSTLENLPLVYDAVNNVVDTLGMDRGTGWMLFASFTTIGLALLVFWVSRWKVLPATIALVAAMAFWWRVDIFPFILVLLGLIAVLAILLTGHREAR